MWEGRIGTHGKNAAKIGSSSTGSACEKCVVRCQKMSKLLKNARLNIWFDGRNVSFNAEFQWSDILAIVMLYETFIRLILINRSVCWSLSKKEGNMLQILERTLRMIYGPINNNGIWRTRYNNELYTLYNKFDTVKVIKIGRFRWLGHLFRMQELDPLIPEGT
jgi:hypothetical protein